MSLILTCIQLKGDVVQTRRDMTVHYIREILILNIKGYRRRASFVETWILSGLRDECYSIIYFGWFALD